MYYQEEKPLLLDPTFEEIEDHEHLSQLAHLSYLDYFEHHGNQIVRHLLHHHQIQFLYYFLASIEEFFPFPWVFDCYFLTSRLLGQAF